MGQEQEQPPLSPHVLVLPFPAEGHITPMLHLSKLLSHRGLKITFTNTHHNHARLQKSTDLPTFHTQFPNINFTSITDGLPKDDPRSTLVDFLPRMIAPEARSKVAIEFRELFISLLNKNSHLQPPSCIIADGLMSTIVMDVAKEFNVPLITFRTYSATCTWVSIHISKLIHGGVSEQDEMDKMITRIPGLENVLRECDFPTVLKLKPRSFALDFYVKETLAMLQASALILNTFDHLEASIISKLATIFPKVYTIGPLHTFLKTQATNIDTPLSNKDGSGLRKEDRGCIAWLDNQKPKSVLYVSFGTVVTLSHEELLEFWHGLVNSGKPFLWVIRHDLINGEGGLVDNNNNSNNVPLELELETKKRGLVVNWAPQQEVLAHPSVGGFLTHSGWNSTLESISEGVSMLCWPILADQPVNSRCVSELWRIGLDMNGTCDRLLVEKMVRDLMENHKEVLSITTGGIAREAKESVREFGSSYHNLENLIKHMENANKCHNKGTQVP